MGRTRISIMTFFAVSLLAYFAMNALASGKVAVLEYSLKPVETLDSGRRIKTEWTAKIRNRAREAVRFTVTVFFVDSNNDEISQAQTQCELKAKETKTFSDTVILKTTIANKIASTRLAIDETP